LLAAAFALWGMLWGPQHSHGSDSRPPSKPELGVRALRDDDAMSRYLHDSKRVRSGFARSPRQVVDYVESDVMRRSHTPEIRAGDPARRGLENVVRTSHRRRVEARDSPGITLLLRCACLPRLRSRAKATPARRPARPAWRRAPHRVSPVR